VIRATESLYYRYEKQRISGEVTASMSNAENFINNTRKGIKEVKCRAFRFNLAGWAICLVGLAIFVAGLIKGSALAPHNGLFAGIFSAMGTLPLNWLYKNAWSLWWLVQAFVPYPDMTQTFPSWSALGSWVGWIAWALDWEVMMYT
jgi:hypothetical protein